MAEPPAKREHTPDCGGRILQGCTCGAISWNNAIDAVANWMLAEGLEAQRRYSAPDVIHHALSPMECNRLCEAKRFASILRGDPAEE